MSLTRKTFFLTVGLLCSPLANSEELGAPWVVFEGCHKSVFDIVYDSMNLGTIVAQCIVESYKVVKLPQAGTRKLSCGCRVISGEKKVVQATPNPK